MGAKSAIEGIQKPEKAIDILFNLGVVSYIAKTFFFLGRDGKFQDGENVAFIVSLACFTIFFTYERFKTYKSDQMNSDKFIVLFGSLVAYVIFFTSIYFGFEKFSITDKTLAFVTILGLTGLPAFISWYLQKINTSKHVFFTSLAAYTIAAGIGFWFGEAKQLEDSKTSVTTTYNYIRDPSDLEILS